MKNLRIKKKIIEYIREGDTLQLIAKKFGISIDALYRLIREYNIDVVKIKERRDKDMVKQLKRASYKTVSERFNVSVQHLKNLEAKYSKDKKADKGKYYNKRWAYKGWIGLD